MAASVFYGERDVNRARTLLVGAVLAGLALGTWACGKSVGETIDDATITTRVKTALLNDPDVAGLKIDVDTFKGIVTLSGSVTSRAEETRAIDLARRVPGVQDVKSTLQVQPAENDGAGGA
jgi:hyperosmotically inducible protein